MRIFGFKPARFRQWREVVRMESRELDWRGVVRLFIVMAWTATRGLFIHDRRWCHKMRKCNRCPIYDRQLKRCRPWTGSPLGCGCFMPFASLVKKHGWATENLPEGERQDCW